MTKKGMTLDQIKAARPTRDYDGRFGKNPAWTPNQFVEAIYRTLDRSVTPKNRKVIRWRADSSPVLAVALRRR